jgi:hypothetical protein
MFQNRPSGILENNHGGCEGNLHAAGITSKTSTMVPQSGPSRFRSDWSYLRAQESTCQVYSDLAVHVDRSFRPLHHSGCVARSNPLARATPDTFKHSIKALWAEKPTLSTNLESQRGIHCVKHTQRVAIGEHEETSHVVCTELKKEGSNAFARLIGANGQ